MKNCPQGSFSFEKGGKMYLNNRFDSPESQKHIHELRQYFPMDLLKEFVQKEITSRKELLKKDHETLQNGGVPAILQKEYDSIEKNHRAQIRGNTMIVIRPIIYCYTWKARRVAKEQTKQIILAAMRDDYWIEEEKNILEDVPDQIIVGWLETIMAGTPPKISEGNTPTTHEFTDELYPKNHNPPESSKCKTWTDYAIRHTASHLDPLHAIALLKHFLNKVREAAVDEDIILPYHRRLSINTKGAPIITLRYNEK
jgi:hypothetical protein